MRWDFSAAIRLRLGETWRDHWAASAAEVAPAFGEIDGLMQHGAHVVGAEPRGELAHGGRIGVVEVVARGEDFDGARAGGCEGVQQTGVQAVLEEDVGGESRLHWY